VAFCALFEDKELHSNNIITSPHYKEKHLMINGTKFTIVHQVSHLAPEIAYIPIEAFISNQLTTNSIHFVLSDIPTKNDYIDIENEINAHFQECTISFPPSVWSINSYPVIASYSQICLLLSSFLFIFLYMSYTRNTLQRTTNHIASLVLFAERYGYK
jgi:hypothetical protein